MKRFFKAVTESGRVVLRSSENKVYQAYWECLVGIAGQAKPGSRNYGIAPVGSLKGEGFSGNLSLARAAATTHVNGVNKSCGDSGQVVGYKLYYAEEITAEQYRAEKKAQKAAKA